MSNVDTFQWRELLGVDVDEEFNRVTRPIRVRSQAELDIITQEISRALKLESVVAEQAKASAQPPLVTEVDLLFIEQPSST